MPLHKQKREVLPGSAGRAVRHAFSERQAP